MLEPKLLREQFDERGEAGVLTLFADRKLEVVYVNKPGLDFDQYDVQSVRLNGDAVAFERRGRAVIIARDTIESLDMGVVQHLEIELG